MMRRPLLRKGLVLGLLGLLLVATTASAALVGHRSLFGAAKSNKDTKAPSLTLSFPTDGGSYTNAVFAQGCRPHGVCGRASDPSGVSSVQIAIQRNGRDYRRHGWFASPHQIFSYAVTVPHHARQVAWHRWLPSPLKEGHYKIFVISTDRLGNTTHLSGELEASFTIDDTPPPVPTFTAQPPAQTTSTSAAPAFTDGEASASFRCRLDSDVYSACQSPDAFQGLAVGPHTFCVVAVDAAGNESAPACVTWTVNQPATGPGQTPLVDFTIAGNAVSTLTPGGPVAPVDLSFSNPNDRTITVTGVTVAVASTSTAACPVAGNFQVARQLTKDVQIPAHSTKSLSQLGLAQSDWPAVQMLDHGNQDACLGASLSLAYDGSAHDGP